MKTMELNTTRTINAGGAYCTVCNYGRYTNYSDWKVMGHIAAKHPAAVLRGMGQLIKWIFS